MKTITAIGAHITTLVWTGILAVVATPSGITAPKQVPEGTTTPIAIEAPGLPLIAVHNSRTGTDFSVTLDDTGSGTFTLPSNFCAGDVLTIVDPNNIFTSSIVEITPATSD